jgi:hypothetical protein
VVPGDPSRTTTKAAAQVYSLESLAGDARPQSGVPAAAVTVLTGESRQAADKAGIAKRLPPGRGGRMDAEGQFLGSEGVAPAFHTVSAQKIPVRRSASPRATRRVLRRE